MTFCLSTWNINSVRLRRSQVTHYLKEYAPDVLCLQETKCPDDQFPLQDFKTIGYNYAAISGQKGYHGVAIVSRRALGEITIKRFCDKDDCRYISAVVEAGQKKIRIHNFYVPAGGDKPDPNVNPKFRHKLDFLEEMKTIRAENNDCYCSLLVGDLNIAPLDKDVWSHKKLLKVISHTPIETTTLKQLAADGEWGDLMRQKIAESEPLFTWWPYRQKGYWRDNNYGRRLDHIWGSKELQKQLQAIDILTDARDWQQPSDHVPVMARFNLD